MGRQQAKEAEQDGRAQRAMMLLAQVAKRHKNYALAALAVRVRLDNFDKIKKVMDKMLAELKKQQSAEVEKKEFCAKSIDETEDKIWEANNVKDDLDAKHKELVNTLDTLTTEINDLNQHEADTEVKLKQAGEMR